MKAGSLNRQITIGRRTAGKGPSGQPLPTWATLGTLWSDVAHDTGKAAIRQSGDIPVPYVRYSFRVRYQAAKNLGVTEGDRITLDGEHYDIKGITWDVKRRNEAFLIAERGGNTG